MKKENISTSNTGELTGRFTRARSAAFRATGQLPPLKEPAQPNLKQCARTNVKRPTLDDTALQRKRRATLKDVTNICCEPTYKSCFNAAKVQAKKTKQVKEGQVNLSKASPSVGARLSTLQNDAKLNASTDILTKDIKSEEAALENNAVLGGSVRNNTASDANWFGYQSSGICSESSSPQRIAEKESFSGAVPASKNPDVVDIDADQEDPQLCSIYAEDIYKHLRVAELARRPSSNFMETIQRDITQSMRGILVDWLVEVAEEYKLVPDSLYLTVHFIDRFLSQNYIERQLLQLLGITCMLIASKHEEICAPRVEEFCFITDSTYTKEQVLRMESQILRYLGFQLFAPTAKTFLRRFLRAAQASYKTPSLELDYLANYLAELTLMDYGFLNFLPSLIAASSVFLARWTINHSTHPWNSTLEHYAQYKASDLKVTVLAIQELQLNATGCPLSAVRTKYTQEKFKRVATLSSPKLLDTLF